MRENPHVVNPAQGYVSSANQSQTDDTYPYWYNGDFVELRAWRINQLLSGMQKATVQDMFAMQNDTYSYLAAGALPTMLSIVTPSVAGSKYMPDLQAWDYKLALDSKGATIFQVWWSIFTKELWAEYADKVPADVKPLPERFMQLLIPDSSAASDDVLAARRRHDAKMKQVLVVSYKHAEDSLAKMERGAGLQWYKVKNTSLNHLAKLPAFSFDSLKIGGWGNAINAVKAANGPSWRMVVQLGQEIEAYGVYPGGQSGNPGSKYYADYVQHWVDGKYYRLHFLPNTDKQDNNSVKYTWKINQ
jgi:penicillin amidase